MRTISGERWPDAEGQGPTEDHTAPPLWTSVATAGAGVACIGLGLAAVVGWHTGVGALIRLHPSLPPLTYTTSLGFIFCGLALLTRLAEMKRASVVAALLCGGSGLAQVCFYFVGHPHFLCRALSHPVEIPPTAHPIAMAGVTALLFGLIGALMGFAKLTPAPATPEKIGDALLATPDAPLEPVEPVPTPEPDAPRPRVLTRPAAMQLFSRVPSFPSRPGTDELELAGVSAARDRGTGLSFYPLPSAVAAYVGVVVFALALVALLGHVVGIRTASSWGRGSYMPPQAATVMLFVGIALIALAWRDVRERPDVAPDWIAGIIGAGTSVATIGIWYSLVLELKMAPSKSLMLQAGLAAGLWMCFLLAVTIREVRHGRLRQLDAEREIEHRRKKEQALRDSELRFRTVSESAPDAIIVTNAGGQVVFWNRCAGQMFGYSFDEIVGRPVSILVPERFRREFTRLLGRIRAGERPEALGQLTEAVALRNTGEEFPVEISVDTWMSGDGCFVGGIVRDVSARKQAEAALALSQEQLGRAEKLHAVASLAAGVAHHFNNLLQIQLGNIELLGRNMTPADPKYKVVDVIRKSGRRGAELVQQLMAFSRKQSVTREKTFLNGIVADTVPLVRSLLPETIEVLVEPGDNLAPIMADDVEIEQILIELAANARDAMPNGGKLTIRTENLHEALTGKPPTRWARLIVKDTGFGMNEAVRSHIFEPFFTTKPTGSGTGMGLPSIYGIVERARGRIHVESQVRAGTTVVIDLPGVAEAPESVVAPAAENNAPTVLVVEDDREIRTLVALGLRERGYRVKEANNAAEALQAWETLGGGVDLLLTDIVMPGQSGLELAKKLKDRSPALKVLYMTGHADELMAELAVAQPTYPILRKPFELETLVHRCQQACADR